MSIYCGDNALVLRLYLAHFHWQFKRIPSFLLSSDNSQRTIYMSTNSTALDKDLQTCLMRLRSTAIASTAIKDWNLLIDAGYDFTQEAPHIQRFAQTLRKWRAREKSWHVFISLRGNLNQRPRSTAFDILSKLLTCPLLYIIIRKSLTPANWRAAQRIAITLHNYSYMGINKENREER